MLQWALIELALNSDVQNKLREELLQFGADPTYDQLANSLPYLDAVMHETLRLHPPIPDVTRIVSPSFYICPMHDMFIFGTRLLKTTSSP
jgi:cytochrome P450